MKKKQKVGTTDTSLNDFLRGKSEHTLGLFNYFIEQYKRIAHIELYPAKTMIGIATPRKRIAYITQLGKNFIHVVFMFDEPYYDNLCFQKVAQVPGEKQFNHHFRMYAQEDLTPEVKQFMKLAHRQGC